MKNTVGVLLCIVLLLLASCGEPASSSTETAAPPTETPLAPTVTPVSPTGVAPAAARSSLTEDGRMEVTRGIVYAHIDGLPTSLDVYAPSQQGPWPVVVVVQGLYGGRSYLIPLAKAIASQGAVVYNIDVAHGSPHLTSSIERIGCAVRFARDTAAGYGGGSEWLPRASWGGRDTSQADT